jgi:hypothetical protein
MRCEFWLEFENGVRMHTEMVDPVKSKTELIPPIDREAVARIVATGKQVIIDDYETNRDDLTTNPINNSQKSVPK